jgi:hypothetical protein
MPITLSKPRFKRTQKRLEHFEDLEFGKILSKYGRKGVDALATATPKDTGEASTSWDYVVTDHGNGRYRLSWTNSKMAGNTPLVILIQYGHGTGTGGYVQGRDFINPALRPIFDALKDELFLEVMR